MKNNTSSHVIFSSGRGTLGLRTLRLGERFLLSSGVTRITLGGGVVDGDVICLAGPPWSGMGWGNKTKCKNKENTLK